MCHPTGHFQNCVKGGSSSHVLNLQGRVHALQCANSSSESERPKQHATQGFAILSKYKKKQTPMAKLKLEGAKVEFSTDTGAKVNVINSVKFDNVV